MVYTIASDVQIICTSLKDIMLLLDVYIIWFSQKNWPRTDRDDNVDNVNLEWWAKLKNDIKNGEDNLKFQRCRLLTAVPEVLFIFEGENLVICRIKKSPHIS